MKHTSPALNLLNWVWWTEHKPDRVAWNCTRRSSRHVG